MWRAVGFASRCLILGLLLAGCQPGSGGSSSSAGGASATAAPPKPAQLKRIAIGAREEADTRPTARGPSVVIQALVRSGLSVRDGAFSNRLQGAPSQWWNQTLGWNAQDWDLQ